MKIQQESSEIISDKSFLLWNDLIIIITIQTITL